MENPQPTVEVSRPSVKSPSRETRPRFPGNAAIGDRTPIQSRSVAGDTGLGPGNVRYLRSSVLLSAELKPIWGSRTGRARSALGGASERRRLERDLHDGVHTELVALIVKLAAAQQNPDIPFALADMLAGLEARALAAPDSVRNIARGIYPPVLADLGVREALRAQAAPAAVAASVVGVAPRSTEEAEEAVYFACSEAIQNAAKHAGHGSQVAVRPGHHHGSLSLQITDDGGGFDPDQTPEAAGLQHIRGRIEDLGGTFELASKPGSGTVLTLSLPWPPAPDRHL